MSSRDAVRLTLVVSATLAGVAVLYQVRHVVLLVAIALFLALGLEPPVTGLQKLVKARAAAVAAMVLLVLVFIAGFFALVAPPIVEQTQMLIDDLPEVGEQLRDESTLLGGLERQFDVTGKLQDATSRLSEHIADIPAVFGSVFGLVADVLAVVFLTLYFLLNAPQLKESGLALVSPERRKRTAEVAGTIFEKVGGWMEGILIVAFIAGVISFIALWLIGVPFSAPLAMWVAIAALIPMVGATLGAIPATIVAFFTSTTTGVVTLVFFIAYQQIENYLIGPRVMKRAVDLSPAGVIVAALAGGTLLGPVGVLLAVPAAAALKVLSTELLVSTSADPKNV